MADTAIPDLTTIAGSAVADTDSLVLADISAGEDKELTIPEALIAFQARGAVKIVFGEPADATILAGSCEMWVDTTASPQTLNVKTRNTNSPEEIVNFVIG